VVVDCSLSRDLGEAGEHVVAAGRAFAEDRPIQVGDDTKDGFRAGPRGQPMQRGDSLDFKPRSPYDTVIAMQLAADKLEAATTEDQAALVVLGLALKYYNRIE